jgi:hypothetical protein
MVKVNAPMMSLDASGSLGGALVFSKWKGRNYIRTLVRPSNPRSVLQVAVRSMMRFLSQNWAGMTAPEKADWLLLAKATSISAFNACVAANMVRWRQYLAPAATTPALETGTFQSCAAATAAGGYHQTVITFTVAAVEDGWGIVLIRSTADDAPTDLGHVVAVIATPTAEVINHTDANLAPGKYYYWWRRFTRAGKLDGFFSQGELSATAT